MIEWSDDDETLVDPPLNTESPPRSTHVEEQAKQGEKVPEQQAKGVPTQQAMEAPKQQVIGVLEQQVEEVPERQAEQRPTMEEMGPPPQSMEVDPMATPGCSSRHHRFKKLFRQNKP